MTMHHVAGPKVMAEIRVPALGESVTEATIGKWFKKPGDAVAVDEPLVELETDKVTIEVPAPAAGTLSAIAAKDGDTVAVGALLGEIKEGAGGAASKTSPAPAGRSEQKTVTTAPTGGAAEQPAPRAQSKPESSKPIADAPKSDAPKSDAPMPPSVRKLAAESGMDPSSVAGSG